MEVMFSWTKPNEHNLLSSFSRFSELELFTYINEFELMMGIFIEESVNIDYKELIMQTIRKSKIAAIIADIFRKDKNQQIQEYVNTS